MRRLGLMLIAIAPVVGVLIVAHAVWATKTAIEAGDAQAAIGRGMNQVLTGSLLGLALAAVGLVVLLVTTWWRGRGAPLP